MSRETVQRVMTENQTSGYKNTTEDCTQDLKLDCLLSYSSFFRYCLQMSGVFERDYT